MKKFVRIALVGAIAALGFAFHSPAQATPGAAAFVGTATTPALSYPIGAGNAGTFKLIADIACAGIDDSAGTCELEVNGTLGAGTLGGAWCGHSAGTGDGRFVGGSHSGAISDVTFSTAAGVIEFSGTLSTAHGTHTITGVGNAVPTGGSCATGTATSFTVTGVAAIN